jgi:TolA-binding protein
MIRAAFLAIVLAAAGFLLWRISRHATESGLSGPLPPIHTRSASRKAALPDAVQSAQPAAAPADKALPGPDTGAGAAHQAALPLNTAAYTPAQQLALLEEILRSRNDNDPRLDTAFNDLSPQAKNLFRRKYRQLPAEGRNELGTVVYLLGRNLKTAEDWAFMRDVVTEPPCLSLTNCSVEAAAGADSHVATGTEITLSYPAVMALKRAERVLQAGGGDAAQALQLIAAGKNSRAKTVSDMAARMEQRYSRP